MLVDLQETTDLRHRLNQIEKLNLDLTLVDKPAFRAIVSFKSGRLNICKLFTNGLPHPTDSFLEHSRHITSKRHLNQYHHTSKWQVLILDLRGHTN